jgi:aspartokinase
MFSIKYGIDNNTIDVTNICLEKLNNKNIITIPHGDINRSKLFTDPKYRTLKKIYINIDDKITVYDDTVSIKINTLNYEISTTVYLTNNEILEKLNNLHSQLQIKYLENIEKVITVPDGIKNNVGILEKTINNFGFETRKKC